MYFFTNAFVSGSFTNKLLRHPILKMYCYKLVVCLCCLVVAVNSSGRMLRRRRGSCEYGTYEHEGKTCCMCPSGYRILVYCTENTTKCELCASGSYMNHPNSVDKCQPCKSCTPEANMKTKEKCTAYSDTVCTCTENYYCDKGDLCRTCYPCDTCEEHGVKTPCTATNNTICNGVKQNNGNIVAGVLVPILVIIGIALLVYFLWRKKKLNSKPTSTENQQLKPLLNDVDLTPYLQDIAYILDLKKMKSVARRTGMHPADIEQHEQNHPQDVKEQTYRILQNWCEAQGLYKAYPTLIKTLRELSHNKTADEIILIVEKAKNSA